MNDKVKKIASYIITFLGGILTLIFGGTILQNKSRRANRARELAEDAREEADRAGNINRELQENNRRVGDILSKVRERPIDGKEKE